MGVEFDGLSEVGNISTASVADTGEFIFHAWVNLKSLSAGEAYLFSANNAVSSYVRSPSTTQRLQCYLEDINAGAVVNTLYPGDSFTDASGWTAIDIVVHQGKQYAKFYVDLVERSSITPSSHSTGTATTNTVDKLVDTGATFVTDGVTAGDIAYNVTDDTWGAITAVDSETSLSFAASTDPFPDGNENYVVFSPIDHSHISNKVGGRLAFYLPDGSMVDQVYVSNTTGTGYISDTGELTAQYLIDFYDFDADGAHYRKQTSLSAAAGGPPIILLENDASTFNVNNGSGGDGTISGTLVEPTVEVPVGDWNFVPR